MSTILAAAGDTVPLSLVVEDGATTLYPVARIYTAAGVPVGGPTALTHVASGLYIAAFVVPAADKYIVRYDIFEDPGFTVDLSGGAFPTRGKGEDLIIADIPAVSSSTLAASVWDAPRANHGVAGTFGEALRVLLGSQGKANFRIDEMVYDLQAFLVSARVRIFPDQATAAASTPGGTGEGEIHTVLLTGSPDGTFPQLPSTVLGLLP